MAFKGIEMALVLVLVTLLCGGAMAQSGCTSVLMGLSPCLNYITGNSSTPSSSCCSNLANVVQSQPQCLCSALSGGGVSIGITINQTLALQLPGDCNVQTPPLSQCNAAGGPAPSTTSPVANTPAGSPSDDTPTDDTPTTVPSTSSIPSGTGSKTVPSTDDGSSNDSGIIKSPIHFIFLLIFAVSCASFTRGF